MVIGAAFFSVIVWSSVASLAVVLGDVPPFLLLGCAFLLGGLPGVFRLRLAFSNARAITIGAIGFYVYHFFLFQGYRLAPPMHVNVINYLWPSLIVLFGALYFDRSLKLSPVNGFGLFLSFAGVAFLVAGSTGGGVDASLFPKIWLGYGCGLMAAISWPIYTWMSRRMGKETSSWNVSAMCLIAGALSILSHLAFEPSFSLAGLSGDQQVYLGLMGLGPFGGAFYAWDYCMKRGDPKLIGSLSYLIPVLSNLALALTLGQGVSGRWAIAVMCVVLGAILASRSAHRASES